MTIQQCLRGALLSAMAAGAVLPAAQAAEPTTSTAKEAYGAIVGVVTNAAGLPVARATVTAVRRDGGGIRATVSGGAGTYSFAALPPGSWAITAEGGGCPEVAAPPLEVRSNKATRYDTGMAAAPPGASPALAAAAPA